MGAIAENGTRSTAAKSGTVVSTRMRPTTLPRYIDAIRPQTKPLCSTNSSGPGFSPHTIRPPSRIAAQRQPLLHRQQDLADPEQADDRDQEVDAAQELVRPEGHAQLAGDSVHADPGEQQAERHGDDGLVLLLSPEPDERAEGQ